jgi:hypothetical protein
MELNSYEIPVINGIGLTGYRKGTHCKDTIILCSYNVPIFLPATVSEGVFYAIAKE